MAELQGASPDEIVRALPHLTLAQVHAALAYYFDHREAILAEMREDQEFAEHFRALKGSGPIERKGQIIELERISKPFPLEGRGLEMNERL